MVAEGHELAEMVSNGNGRWQRKIILFNLSHGVDELNAAHYNSRHQSREMCTIHHNILVVCIINLAAHIVA